MRNKWIYIITALVVVLIAGAIVFAINYDRSSSDYVATVDGEKIKTTEYNYFLNSLKVQWEQTAGVIDPATGQRDAAKAKTFWETAIEGKNAVDSLKDKALEEAKSYKVQLIKAKENKITLDKTELDSVDQYVESVIANNGGKEAAEKAVKEAININLDQFKEIYTNYQIINKLRTTKIDEKSPKDDEISKYVQDNKKSVEFASVRHILFMTVDAEQKPLSKEKQDEAKKKADDMLVKVNAGEDMKDLAEKNSEDPGVTSNGGLYEFDGNGQNAEQGTSLIPEFPTWAFDANRKVGDTGIISTTYGYHVVKLEKISSADEEKNNAKKALQSEAYSKEIEEWNKDPKYNATINNKVFNSLKVAV